jgi:hypothetical protein
VSEVDAMKVPVETIRVLVNAKAGHKDVNSLTVAVDSLQLPLIR